MFFQYLSNQFKFRTSERRISACAPRRHFHALGRTRRSTGGEKTGVKEMWLHINMEGDIHSTRHKLMPLLKMSIQRNRNLNNTSSFTFPAN